MILLCVLVCVGIFLWLTNIGVLILSRDWPIILIIVGCGSVVTLAKTGRKKKIIQDLEKGKISATEAEARLRKCT